MPRGFLHLLPSLGTALWMQAGLSRPSGSEVAVAMVILLHRDHVGLISSSSSSSLGVPPNPLLEEGRPIWILTECELEPGLLASSESLRGLSWKECPDACRHPEGLPGAPPAPLIIVFVHQTSVSAMFTSVSPETGGCDKALALKDSVVLLRRQTCPQTAWLRS